MSNNIVFPGIRMNLLAVVAGVFFLSMAGVVTAEDADQPCVADAKKFCDDVRPGEGRVAQCMKEHEKDLSPGCKKNIVKMKEKIRDVAESCKDDAAKFCMDIEPGKGRILRCLKQHQGELSTACNEQLMFPHTRN